MEAEEKIIGRCPLCGDSIVKACKGYHCKHNIGGNPPCALSINGIIGSCKTGDREVAELLKKRRILLDGLAAKGGKTFPTIFGLANDGAVSVRLVIGKCPHCGGDIRVKSRTFNCSSYGNQEKPYPFAIWRSIGGHRITPAGVTDICERGIIASELEMYQNDGSICRERLGFAPDKLQIVRIRNKAH